VFAAWGQCELGFQGSVSWDFKQASGRVLKRTMVAVKKA
jgi:hypothetical protein